MRTPALKNWAVILGCCSAWQVASAGDAARSQTPVNLARPNAGAQLVVEGAKADGSSPGVLLRDDDPLGYPLAAGDTSMTLTLPQIEVVKRFNFLNLTAAGKVTVSVSSAKKTGGEAGWREVQAKSFSGTDVVSCDLGSIEAREVKIDFHLDTAGRVDTFGLFGLRTIGATGNSRYAASSADKKALLYNYAVSSPDAGVIMVSPGEDIKGAQALADGDVGTSFAFKATDPEPMAVVDLGTTRTLNRVSVSFKAGAGHMDVYLLADPQDKSALQKGATPRSIQDVVKTDFPAGHEPILTAETGKQAGLNRVSGNVNSQTGRYLVLDFHPAAGAIAANGAGDFKDFKDADFKDGGRPQQATGAPLEVSELTAYGDQPPGTFTSNTPGNFPGVPNVPPNIPPQNPFPPVPGGSSTVSP